MRILDVGCAEGKVTVYLASKGHEVTAADISNKYLQMAEDLAKENFLDIKFCNFSIEKDNEIMESESFDLIYLMDVIEHLRCPIAALENLRELL